MTILAGRSISLGIKILTPDVRIGCIKQSDLREKGLSAHGRQAPFPPKVFFGKDDAPTVAARVVGLERWLNRMLGLAPSDPTILGAHQPWCIHM